MDIFDKLFNREPKAEPMPDPNLKRISEMSGRLSTQDRALLDDMVYLSESRNKIMQPQAPKGEKLAYINAMEEEILKNSGASVPTMTPEGIPSFSPDDPLKQAAALLNSAAPQGESLAYINSEEAEMLKDAGGAGEPVNSSGVPSFFLNKLFGGGKAPPSMPKLDVGKSARDYVNAMSDPAIQGKLLQTRQTYDPQYQDLQLSLAQRAADPMADLAESNAMRAQDFGAQMAERQAGSDISMMNRFGADFNQAVRASDPLMQARVEQANQMADQAFRESQIQDLSPEMRRRATQSAREGLVARGRDMDNAAIAAEAMSREDYLRDIIRDNRQQAQGLGSYASGLNRATSVDPMSMLRGGNNYTQQGYGERAALFGIPQEQSTRINPDAGVNIGLQDNANRANYLANTYAAREQAASGMASGLMGMVGSIAGGYLGRG
jgi:hypothetical protein|tara:strand:+ start:1357 stop:2664 length:1308 start_codon:yes stop_codon:yes gene_type:complete